MARRERILERLQFADWNSDNHLDDRGNFSQVYHTHNATVLCSRGMEVPAMDVVYLLMLGGLYVVSHGLVVALNRLGVTS